MDRLGSDQRRRIFDQILTRNGNKVDASIAANDGLAGAVIASLKAHGLKSIPLTGQDATPTGVQFIPRRLAERHGLQVRAQGGERRSRGSDRARQGPEGPGRERQGQRHASILLTPVWVTKRNYKLLFNEGFLKRSQVCVGQYKKYCT